MLPSLKQLAEDGSVARGLPLLLVLVRFSRFLDVSHPHRINPLDDTYIYAISIVHALLSIAISMQPLLPPLPLPPLLVVA